jgi:arylsulfatase A-like enzyme
MLLLASQIKAADWFNVLFIAVDDMRPQLGCYGDKTVKSPNIDKLAERGLVFKHSYVQQALCSPSRISMLSGRYPATTQIFEIGREMRTTMPDIVTLPQHFKNCGYETRSLGKIFHSGIDDLASWSVPPIHSKVSRYSPQTDRVVKTFQKEAKKKGITIPKKGKGSIMNVTPAYECVNCTDEQLTDGDTAQQAIAQIKEFAAHPEKPFFYGVGFLNPHVPWISPKKYWDMYDPSTFTLPKNDFPPRNAPHVAAKSLNGMKQYKDYPTDGKHSHELKIQALHGYYAAISYVDALVGKVLTALEETGLAKNTIVILWSDHGYYMGEHGWWACKHNNYEGATRNCMIIATPGMKTAGKTTLALAQSVDIAPTLTELCGLPAEPGFQGRSLVPVLNDSEAQVNDAAFSWYPSGPWLGLAMRTNDWRYVEWTQPGKPTERELYSAVKDPQNNNNVAEKPENAKVLLQLAKQLGNRFPDRTYQMPPADITEVK